MDQKHVLKHAGLPEADTFFYRSEMATNDWWLSQYEAAWDLIF
jgi:hypothetical protein